MNYRHKLGIIGTGVMAGALLTGIERNISNIDLRLSDILIYDIDNAKLNSYRESGFVTAKTAQEVLTTCEFTLIAVKPQHYKLILGRNEVSTRVLISIMAGVKIDTLRKHLPLNSVVFRIMPNISCLIGKGISAIAYTNTTQEDVQFVRNIFQSSGEVLEIDEKDFDAVTSLSGSGPAYVYLFIDAMIKAGIEGGLSYDASKMLVTNTLIGASELAKNSSDSLETLIDRVCSKGGTTIEAMNSFREDKFYEIVSKAVKACRERSEELSETYS